MELADKSFSDLIRRLPIIILEDSFLHHDFDLLVWLMVAESKVGPSCSLGHFITIGTVLRVGILILF
jgi:hypothetical protein